MVVLDPDQAWVVDPERFLSKGKNSPLGGQTLRGTVLLTIAQAASIALPQRPMSREAALALEDGSIFIGEPFGADDRRRRPRSSSTRASPATRRCVTDPSYRGQMVVMTHPQIGNYGIADSGDESVRPWVSGLIVRELAEQPHHWESRSRLEEFLQTWGVPGLQGIDTRALVRRLRESGTQRGVLQAQPSRRLQRQRPRRAARSRAAARRRFRSSSWSAA